MCMSVLKQNFERLFVHVHLIDMHGRTISWFVHANYLMQKLLIGWHSASRRHCSDDFNHCRLASCSAMRESPVWLWVNYFRESLPKVIFGWFQQRKNGLLISLFTSNSCNKLHNENTYTAREGGIYSHWSCQKADRLHIVHVIRDLAMTIVVLVLYMYITLY